jgi:hypothetical protein
MRTAAPPPPAIPRHRATTTPRSASAPTATSSTPSVPPSWAGLHALLTEGKERVPNEALTLSASIAARGDESTRVDLTGMWALPATQAPVRSRTALRALDKAGRLCLPITADAATQLPAERDGDVITVFLPGASAGLRPGFTAAAQTLDARGRLTLRAALRREAGIPDGADVVAYRDPEQHTITITSAFADDEQERMLALLEKFGFSKEKITALAAALAPATESVWLVRDAVEAGIERMKKDKPSSFKTWAPYLRLHVDGMPGLCFRTCVTCSTGSCPCATGSGHADTCQPPKDEPDLDCADRYRGIPKQPITDVDANDLRDVARTWTPTISGTSPGGRSGAR